MKILAFDTSSRYLSVAITDGETLLAESEKKSESGHSGALAPEIAGVLRAAGLGWDEVGCIAVGLGPGSFTGLRIGLATAKMLAWSLGKKLVGVPSLEAVAAGRMGASRVAVLLDAKRGNFYAALYERKNGGMLERKKAAVLAPADISRWPAAETIVVEGEVHPRARFIAAAGFRMARAKKYTDPFRLEPLYLHPRDCNAVRKTKTKDPRR